MTTESTTPFGLLAGIATCRSIRRYTDEPIGDDDLRDICFAATRAPSGSNRQPFRLMGFRHGDRAAAVKGIIASGGQRLGADNTVRGGVHEGSG